MEITNVPGLWQEPGSQSLGKRELAKAAQGAGRRLAQGKREPVLPAREGTPGTGAGRRQEQLLLSLPGKGWQHAGAAGTLLMDSWQVGAGQPRNKRGAACWKSSLWHGWVSLTRVRVLQSVPSCKMPSSIESPWPKQKQQQQQPRYNAF